jgi:DNA-binding beta-propeller fold protein YncE
MKITTEGYPHRMMLHPNGKTGYVIGTDNSGGESTPSSPSTLGGRYFMKFSIDDSTGRLLQLPAPRLTLDHHATEMAFGARGRRFFVVGNHYDNLKQDYIEEYLALNSAGEISVFRTYVIDRSPDTIPTDKCARMRNRVGSGGDLRDVPDDLRLTPNGKFAYMVDCAPEMDRDLRLVAFAIEPMSGEFKRFDLTDPAVRGLLDVRIALSPQGTYLYASDTEGVKLHAFRVNRDTGQLQALPGSPFPTAPKPGRVIVSPDGRFVYVVHPDAKLISAYSVAKMTGMLMPVQGSPFRQNGSPLDMTIDAAQSFAYTPLRDQMGIDVFKIDDETGALRMFERGPTQNTYVEEFALTP